MASVQERRMIGPHEAAEILELNRGNRKIDQNKVHFYARQMREGRWRDTGVPIIIYKQGLDRILDDGQHRLMAIIECGMTIPMTISIVDWERIGERSIRQAANARRRAAEYRKRRANESRELSPSSG